MYRILVADDEPIERQVVTKRIQKNFPEQIEVFTAQNGREAMEIFEQENCRSRFSIFPCRVSTDWKRQNISGKNIRRVLLFF